MRFILVGALSSLIYALIVAILVGGLDIVSAKTGERVCLS